MIELAERRGKQVVLGTEVLSWRISLPRGENGTRMEKLFREIGDRAERFCREDLCPWTEKKFEECKDPKKRFHFPAFSYQLDTRIREEGRGTVISLEAIFKKRGDEKPLSRWGRELIWSEKEDCLLLPLPSKKTAKKRDYGKGGEKK